MVQIRTPRLEDDRLQVEVAGLDESADFVVVLLDATGAELGSQRIPRPSAQQRQRGRRPQPRRAALEVPETSTGVYTVAVTAEDGTVLAERAFHLLAETDTTTPQPPATRVQLDRTAVVPTEDRVLTDEILRVSRNRRFSEYQAFVDDALASSTGGAFSPQAYDTILRSTREFLELDTTTIIDVGGRFLVNGHLPYLENVASRFADVRGGGATGDRVSDVDERLLERPSPVELIWSYWTEEAGVPQTLNHILARFQNRRVPTGEEPLTRFSLNYLRPLRNLLFTWGDREIDRLTVRRRAAEYQYEYGLDLIGRAVPGSLRYVEQRSRFLESFHTLLHEALVFYRLDDDTTVVANAFPVLNALRDTHMVLAEGAENQFDGVPLQARVEMLAMEYVLAQPEMRDFLGGRPMVPYEEAWMDRVDTMRQLYGWGDASVSHFHELAVHGEVLVQTVRWGNWNANHLLADSAANWARTMRESVQRYVHAYRTVTGVDLQLGVDATMPAVLLARRTRARARA